MDVLLVGNSGSLMSSMANRLGKEGHRIFMLCGDRNGKRREKRMFECYCFDYENESVPQIFESVRPEVTLFLGPWDPNFQVKNETQAMHYFSGLTNLLVSFSMLHQGRFVYLSTSDIFQSTDGSLITEEDQPHCTDPRSLVLAQAEEICLSYRKNLNLDVAVLRLDQLYSIPKNRNQVRWSCDRLCLEACESNTVTWNSSGVFSMLYEADAVEFIHRVMFCETHREGIYNVSSSVPVTEEELAKYIEGCGLEELTLKQTNRAAASCVLSNKRFQEEFGMRFFSDPQKMTERTLRYMQEHPKDFKKPKEKKPSLLHRIEEKLGWLAAMLIPYIENLICFLPFFMLNNRAVGSQYFDRLDFYLLYVLLFAIIYGQRQATFSAILSMAGYCFRQMYTKSGFEVLTSYNTYVWLAQLFIVGLVVGYMRDKLREQKQEDAEEKLYLNSRVDDIFSINRSNVRVKDALRTQIINQNNSLGKVYSITSSLNRYTTEEVLFYAAEIMAELMETKDVAIYTVSGKDFARLFSSTSEMARCMGRSLRYRQTGEMYQTIMKHQVYINREMDQSLPMMANAIFENEEMKIIIMAWGLPWEAMTLGQANLMSVVSALIQEAVLRAGRYMTALESQRYEKDEKILNQDAFSTLLKAFLNARSRGLTDCTLMRCDSQDAFSRVEEIRAMLRQSDYLGTLDNQKLYFLLSNTGHEDAQVVYSRMLDKGLEVSIVEEPDL